MGLTDEQTRLVFDAGNTRFNPQLHCSFHEFAPGWFALYKPGRTFPLLITDDFAAMLDAYRARGPYIPHRGAPSEAPSKTVNVKGVDLSSLKISI